MKQEIITCDICQKTLTKPCLREFTYNDKRKLLELCGTCNQKLIDTLETHIKIEILKFQKNKEGK